jgi:phosphopantothenoylcysteine decarboxylase/phosphopantothenate--cysteine ligase
MSRILITSGPTRQYLDPVRYLTNASSGRMGCSLAEAALESGHEVILVSGPVQIDYPVGAEVHTVISTEEMLHCCEKLFPDCDGLIGVAAPCDYRPEKIESQKIAKTGEPLQMKLLETDDIVATLGKTKGHRWVVGFALETDDPRLRALIKLERKSCDLMVLNGIEAMHSEENEVEIIAPDGQSVAAFKGGKNVISREIFQVIENRLIAATAEKIRSGGN